MRIALVLVCCLILPTFGDEIVYGAEPLQRVSNDQLTEEQRIKLGKLQNASDDTEGSERQPRQKANPVKTNGNPVVTPTPSPSPPSAPTPTPTPTPTPSAPPLTPELKLGGHTITPIDDPAPSSNASLGFVVSLLLLILVGLVILLIMGRKIYTMIKG